MGAPRRDPPPARALAYRPDLDGLRAVAVLAVVLYHAAPALLPGGYVGVDVFFVVSGYLITAISLGRLRAGTFTFADFYARRARRLLPALMMVMVACLAVGAALYDRQQLHALGQAAAAAGLFGANLHFYAAQDYFAAPMETQPLLHLWSLGVEEQFYLAAPLLLAGLHRRQRLLWGVTAIAVGVSLLGSVVATWTAPQAAFYLPWFRAWELGLGALWALRPQPLTSPRARAGQGTLGLLGILGSLVALNDHTRFPGLAALPATLGTLALVASGPHNPVARALSAAPLRAIGRWSYAWYLWHWPALVFATLLLQRRPSLLEAAGLCAASLAIAAASTEWVEAPVRRAAGSAATALRLGGVATLGLTACGLALALTNQPAQLAQTPAQLTALMTEPPGRCAEDPTQGHQVLVCAQGDVSQRPDLVLLGDSHAAMLASTIEDLAQVRGRTSLVVTRNHCPPAVGVERADRSARERCAVHTTTVFAHLAATRPRRVLLHARWPMYVEQRVLDPRDRTQPRLVVAGTRTVNADLADALQDTITQLQAMGAEVFVLGSVPEQRVDVPEEWERRAQVGLPPPEGAERAEVDARGARSLALLTDVCARTGARLLHPADVLCDDDRCRLEHDGELLYRDDNHLTPAGAALLGPLLQPTLAE